MSVCIPQGFAMAGVHCRIKRDPQKLDLSLICSDEPCAAAGVYTRNLVFAAPVALDSARTPSDQIRVVLINSGNANACTGERGLRDAQQSAKLAAEACGALPHQALVMSTGIIGEFLPMDKIEQGICAAAVKLGKSEACLLSAARGMLTTDTTHKLAGRAIEIEGHTYQIVGMAKGAAMMGPNMATMLALVLTDAPIEMDDAQELLSTAVDRTFNCISVEGHTSTNDTVLFLANGAAGGEQLAGPALETFRAAFEEVCAELARAIPADGEGCTHLVTIDVSGCADREAARQIARTVANSALVKAAVSGADPNWGRIVSAAGYAGVPFDPMQVALRLNGFLLYEAGAPVTFDAKAVSQSIRDNREVSVQLSFGEGDAAIRFWTTDITAEYVRLNADYHT
ncbi:MAG: bifunctional glutamate N-acetyltransferase/amino-acid acetyltransferase ArgJ [Planctomycetota bacterium]